MPEPGLRMYIFDAGWVITQGVRFINEAGIEETRDMHDPNHCYLIRHPSGLLMWDAGLPDRIAHLPDQTLEKGKFRFRLDTPLADQLAGLEVSPDQVSFLAFSHLQIDHAGNTGLFSKACVLLQAEEHLLAFGPDAQKWGYEQPDFEAIGQQKMQLLEGDHDVFRDGKVMLLRAPGHTPGHQVLFVDLASGPLILSGDLYYTARDPTEHWMPNWNYQREQTLETMAKLDDFARGHGARWIFNHDREQRKILPLAPSWLE